MPAHVSRDVRPVAVLLGVACTVTTVVGIRTSAVRASAEDPALLAAALGSVAVGTGVVATVSLYLFASRSLLVPALAGLGYLAVVYGGLALSGRTGTLETTLSLWPWTFAAVLLGGLVEHLLRSGLEAATGRFGPRSLV